MLIESKKCHLRERGTFAKMLSMRQDCVWYRVTTTMTATITAVGSACKQERVGTGAQEIRYIAHLFNVSDATVSEAIATAGPMRTDVYDHLRRGKRSFALANPAAPGRVL